MDASEMNVDVEGMKFLSSRCFSPEEERSGISDRELHPALRFFANDDDDGDTRVHHPLIIMSLGAPVSLINEQYVQIRRVVDQHVAAGDWAGVILHTQKPYRLAMLQYLQATDPRMTAPQYWAQLGKLWIDDDISVNREDWEVVIEDDFDEQPEHVRCFMNEEERAIFAALPETLTVYRGYCRAEQSDGLSYTLNPTMADWFASNHGFYKPDIEPTVRSIRVSKSRDLFAFKSLEEEVIVRPSALWKLRKLHVPVNGRHKDSNGPEVPRLLTGDAADVRTRRIYREAMRVVAGHRDRSSAIKKVA